MRSPGWLLALLLASCSTTSKTVVDGASGASGAGGSSGSAGSTAGGAGNAGGSAGLAGAPSGGSGNVGGSAGSTASGGSAGAAGAGGSDELASLNDGFEDSTLDPKWQILNGNLIQSLQVSNSELRLVPRNSVWWQDGIGPLVYQQVNGDFRMTATVRVRTADDLNVPSNRTHWGGIMLRDPNVTPQNYVDVVVGRDDPQQPLQIEHNSTGNNISDWGSVNSPGDNEAELRLCRLGTTVWIYSRAINSILWEERAVFDRPDLPLTVQAGIIGHALDPADLLVRVDDIRFGRVTVQGDCLDG